jgi:DNA polymerase-3 subunit delta'
MATVHPWQKAAFILARAAIKRGAHALLLAGARGVGKRDLAIELARSYLCADVAADGAPCNTCDGCRWFAAGTHPDYLLVEPIATEDAVEEGAPAGYVRTRPISVEQIREVGELLSLSAHRDAGKVIVIAPANSLNVAASNALLKNLEEPPAGSLFILVADRPAMLLATVRSRCQLVPLRLADRAGASTWLAEQGIDQPELSLALCGGAPLAAMEIADDPAWRHRQQLLLSLSASTERPFELANSYRELPPALVLSWLAKWSYDVVMASACGRVRYHVDLRDNIDMLISRVDPMCMSRLHRRLLQMQRHAQHPLNPRLFLEQMLAECADAVRI